MTPDHVVYADWDAAYLMRALSADDRRTYESHLDECPVCREAIADLAPALGLLARVAPDRAESLLGPAGDDLGPDPLVRARLVETAARRSRRRRVVAWGAGLAAAAAVALVIAFAVTPAVAPVPAPEAVVALEPVADAPVTATVELTDVAWGTRIAMECRYSDTGDPYAADREWSYALVVTAADGTVSELSTWRAGPGSTARLEAGTALDRADIAAIEVRAVGSDRVLLRSELGESSGG